MREYHAVYRTWLQDPRLDAQSRDELAAIADKQGLASISELTGEVNPW